MASRDIFKRLKSLDAYPKTLDDFAVKTLGGGLVSIISGLFMLFLFLSELRLFMTTEVKHELLVDTTRGEKLRINMDITFPRMPCAYLSIDAMDVSGEQQLDVVHNLYKKRLDSNGLPVDDSVEKHEDLGHTPLLAKDGSAPLSEGDEKCPSCFGAESEELPCCHTCEDVREAYRRKGWAFSAADTIPQCIREGWTEKLKAQASEGCNVFGYLEVNKVAGNFHFAPGKSFQQHHMHVHDLQPFKDNAFNLSHTITRLSFGLDYPGIVNPLDNSDKISPEGKGSHMYQYFVKIVPTVYHHLDGSVVNTNQFSATTHQSVVNTGVGGGGLPGVFFMYDLSPMLVKFTERRQPLLHFLTGVCAIIGGIFTVAGMVDAALYHSMKSIKKKIEMGKQT
eukprot:Colp12_sorted_trinity150504_noHs@32023